MQSTIHDEYETFEAAWRDTAPGAEPPLWVDFLPANLAKCPHDLITLFIETDIERRIKSGRPGLLSQRYWEHPQLGRWSDAQKLELIQFELVQRRRARNACSALEYSLAFPDLTEMLQGLQYYTPGPDEDATPSGAPAANAPSSVDESFEVPGYILQKRIGGGGMGIIWKAKDVTLERHVAIKVLSDEFSPLHPLASRLIDEARIQGQLQHPGVPAVHEVGRLDSGRPFFAMKFIKGRSLDKLLEEHASLNIAAIFDQIAQAIGYAHAHNVIHRDLKPANIMVGDFGEVQVIDWGLAKVLGAPEKTDEHSAELTAIVSSRNHPTQGELGTPAFAPPEQAVGEHELMTERSDVFGLGAILCAMLTGQPPYVAPTAKETKMLARFGKLDGANARLAECGGDPDLIALCLSCLKQEPGARLANGMEVARAAAKLRADAEERAMLAELDAARAEVRVAAQKQRRRVQQRLGLAIVASLLVGIGAATALALYALTLANRANREKERADQTAAELRKQKDEAERSRQRTEALLYASRLEQSQRYWNEGRIEDALQQLNDCRWDLRGWEHHFAWTQFAGRHVTLPELQEAVLSAAFAGDSLVVWTKQKTLRLVDARRGTTIRDLPVPSGMITTYAVSPDGRTIAAATDAGEVHFFPTAQAGLRTAKVHTAAVVALAFDAAGKRLVSAGRDRQLMLTDADTATTEKLPVPAEPGEFTALAWSADGKWLAAGRLTPALPHDPESSKDGAAPDRIASKGMLLVWEFGAAQPKSILIPSTQPVTSVAFSPDSRTLAANGDEDRVRVWRIVSAQNEFLAEDRNSPAGNADHLSFSPDGSRLLTASDQNLRLWEVVSLQSLGDFRGHLQRIRFARFSPDGSMLLSGDTDDPPRLWHVLGSPASRELFQIPAATVRSTTLLDQNRARAFAFAASPDGAWIVTGADTSVQLWNARTGTVHVEFRDHSSGIESAAFSPDSTLVATGGRDGIIRIVNLPNRTVTMIPECHSGAVIALAFSANGQGLASAGEHGGLHVHDLAGRRCTLKTNCVEVKSQKKPDDRPTGLVTALSLSPDGRTLVAGCHDSRIRVWHLDRPDAEPRLLNGHVREIRAVAISPDGHWLASAGVDQNIRLWDLAEMTAAHELVGHSKRVTSLAFDHDSQRLISGSWDRTVRVWHVASGATVLELRQNSPIEAVAFSSRQDRILAAGLDHYVRVWEARCAAGTVRLVANSSSLNAAAFSPDGSLLLARDSDGRIFAWDRVTGQPADWTGDRPVVFTERPAPQMGLILIPAADALKVHFQDRERRHTEFMQSQLNLWYHNIPRWHLDQARAAESARQWHAAIFHYQRYLQAMPNDPAARRKLDVVKEQAKKQ